ncbi:hypothetical protein KO489_08285 [Reinekea forsetii]|nr:hypothetical protein [Reinekea forsetii]
MTMATASLHLYGSSALLGHLKNARLPLLHGSNQLSPYLETGQKRVLSQAPITEHEINQELRRQFEALPGHISALLSFEDFTKQSEKLMPSIEAAIKARRQQSKPGSNQYSTERFHKVSYLRLFNSALSHYGWQCLADQFSGICVELEANHDVFQSNDERLALLKAVQYGATHDFNVSGHNPIPGFFLDNPENALREEWRAAFLFAEPQPVIKIQARIVRRIYLSVNADETLVEDCQRLVSQDLRYRHAELSFVVPDEQQWRLRVNIDQ